MLGAGRLERTSRAPGKSESQRLDSLAGSGLFQEQGVVQEAGEEASCKGTNPVDAVILPMGRRQGRAEGASGIERATGEGTGHQDAQHDADTNGETSYGAE